MASATKLDVSQSVELYEEAVRLMPGGSQTKGKRPNPASYGAMPIFMSHGKGSRLWDVNGNSYIDYYGASGGVLLGYCYPEVDRAVAEQLEKGMLFSTPSEPEIECAKLVNEVVPCSEMVRFLKGGVDVNLCATRIARAYTKRESHSEQRLSRVGGRMELLAQRRRHAGCAARAESAVPLQRPQPLGGTLRAQRRQSRRRLF